MLFGTFEICIYEDRNINEEKP